MSFEQRKATEYLSMLKQKSTEEITSMMDSLRGKMKMERSKQTPDQSTIQNLNWQLSLLGREFSTRKPITKKDPMQVISNEQQLEVGGTTESPLKTKTLDELKSLIASSEKELQDFQKSISTVRVTPEGAANNKSKIDIMQSAISNIKNEISSRSEDAQNAAKKDISTAESKLGGIDGTTLIIGALAGLTAGAITLGMKKKWMTVAGFAIAAFGAGTGITYLIRKPSTTSTSGKPYGPNV